jgi:hypothetical protein
MWWWLVIDYYHKIFDNCCSQELAFRGAVMNQVTGERATVITCGW